MVHICGDVRLLDVVDVDAVLPVARHREVPRDSLVNDRDDLLRSLGILLLLSRNRRRSPRQTFIRSRSRILLRLRRNGRLCLRRIHQIQGECFK